MSIYSARGSLGDILAASSASEHPPLHALSLALWIRASGDSEFAVRYLSAWWGVLAVACTFRLGRQLCGHLGVNGPALAALLVALSPFAIWYSQETRGYSMALALVTAAASVGEAHLAPPADAGSSTRQRWSGRLAYVLLAAAALYAHLYSALVLVAFNLALAFQHVQQLRRTPASRLQRRLSPVLYWIGAQIVVMVLLVPWLPTIADQWQINATYFHGAVDWKQIVRRTLLALSVGETLEGLWAEGAAGAYLLLASLGTVALARQRQTRPSTILLWLWILVPLSFQIVLNRRLPKFNPRYMLNLLPPLLLLTSTGADWLFQRIGLRDMGSRGRRGPAWSIGSLAAIAALLAATALVGGAITRSLANHYLDRGLYRPDVRAVARYIETHAAPDDTIVLLAGHNAPAFSYYYRGVLPVVALPDKLLPDTRAPLDIHALETLDRAIQGRARLWLVLWQASLADPTGLITDELEHTYPRLGVSRTFHDVALLLFDVSSGPRLAQVELPRTPLQAQFQASDAPQHTQVRLLGYDLDRQTARPSDTLYLYLYWQAMDEIPHDYKVFTQLVGAENVIVAQHDKVAGADAYPTSHWPVGAIVRDRFLLTLDASAPPGQYTLIAGLYRPGQNLTRLRVRETDRDHVILAHVNVE